MAYALGYDTTDFASDDEDSQASTSSSGTSSNLNGLIRNGGSEKRSQSSPPSAVEMDKMDTGELERLEWMEPLGYRALSEITGLPPAELRRHFWATQLKTTSPEYQDIEYYFRNGGGEQMKTIKRVVNLKRFKETNCDYNDPNVMLLWHGTPMRNVAGILTNGLGLPGQGVYFADRAIKSIAYCRGHGVLFLCAVNLGKTGQDSSHRTGNSVPDPNDVRLYRGAKIPCGKTIGPGGFYSEYVIWKDLTRISILFLVEI